MRSATVKQAPPAQRELPTSVAGILAALTAVILGAFMAILDATVVNVALPTFGRVFESSLQSLQWIITGYMLAQAAVIPLSGWLSDRFGSKQVYLVAMIMFTLGSALCAMATSASLLIAFRVVQGLGGGMLMPVGMAVLYRLAPPEKRGAVMGIFGIPMLMGPALGPVLSGWLLEYASWPWIFLINVPVGILAVIIGLRSLPSFALEKESVPLDIGGMLLGPLAFAALTFGISQSTEAGWTGTATLGGIALGLAALAGFIWRELTSPYPLIELRVFKSRDFALAIFSQWAVFAGLFGTMFVIPLFLQSVRGYTPFQTGLITLPQALVAAFVMPVAGRLFDWVGVRPPAVAGLSIVAVSMWLLTGMTPETTGWDMLLPLGLMGAGMGLVMMPLGTHVLNSAPRDLVSRVTSLTGACQSVVAALAVASFATLLQTRIADLANGGAVTDLVQATAYGDVYRYDIAVIAVAILLAATLRRQGFRKPHGPSPNGQGAGAPVPDVVHSV